MEKNLVWKLLRQHISIPQFAGFVFANLIGMTIVLLGFQFYRDIIPLLTAEDGYLKSNFVVVSKKVGTAQTMNQRPLTFSPSEIDELRNQGFIERVGQFTAAEFKVNASMSIEGKQVLNSELPIESVPDEFVDISSDEWTFSTKDSANATETVVPIILPRSYLAMYNFGFAQNRSLPKVSEGLVGMITFDLLLRGNGQQQQYKGRVIGFSGRLNAILVPQSFMEMANGRFAPDEATAPTRLLVTTGNLAEDNISAFFEDHGFDVENEQLNTEKTTFFLRLMITVVMAIGLVISLLSFYILMLSIYLLVQKNADKLQNLLLIGYKPSQVARPYQLLTIGLNVVVLLLALVVVALVRSHYMRIVEVLFATTGHSSLLPAILMGLLLLVVVTLLNMAVIRRKIIRIWHGKERI
ncbi:MAG: ABC transporter permease [Prevotella sp.]|nr:ABC transporter permease [Prevotella sp.]